MLENLGESQRISKNMSIKCHFSGFFGIFRDFSGFFGIFGKGVVVKVEKC